MRIEDPEQARLTKIVLQWMEDRIERWGNMCYTTIGNDLDWGQAACFQYYGPDWMKENLELIPEDIGEVLSEWDDDYTPEWFDDERYAPPDPLDMMHYL